jgi:SAM-dependent methyltransferase
MALALVDAGFEVTAIDPAAEPGTHVQSVALIDADGAFDAAVAVVSLHHVNPLEESCAHLATLIRPGGFFVIDEIDSDSYDTTAANWWLRQRQALGFLVETADPAAMVQDLRQHIHPASRVAAALSPHFEFGAPVRGPYLHRWELRPSLYGAEVDLIATGDLPAIGWRQVAVRN